MPENSRPASRRPKSIDYISLVRAVCIGSSCMAGVAIALGALPDALASGGVNAALPVMLAVVVSFGLAVAWHILVPYAAHAREPHKRAIALGFGLGFGLTGLSLCGWFLVAIIGGTPAMMEYSLAYVAHLRAESDIIVRNAALEHGIIEALNTGAGNFELAAKQDAATGILSGHRGSSVVVGSLRDAAKSMEAMSARLTDQQHDQAVALSRARDALGDAGRSAADNDTAGFQDSAARAANEVRTAAKTQLGAAALNIGSVLAPAAQQLMRETSAMIASVIEDINARRRTVTVPDFQPVDAKMAVFRAPQPLAILAAVAVELVPVLCLGLLLTLWRDKEKSDDDDHDDDHDAGKGENVVPIRPSSPYPITLPAE